MHQIFHPKKIKRVLEARPATFAGNIGIMTPYPKHLMLEVTDRCNLKCIICSREEYEGSIGGPGALMNYDDLMKIKEPIRSASIITVTGFGESFLHPRLKEILDYIYGVNPADNLIKIVTNGTALAADKAAWFSGHLHTMSISLNASHSEGYAREMHPYEVADGRDVSNKFSRLISRIQDFSDQLSPADRRKVHLHYVVHRDNMAYLSDFVRLTARLGLSEVQFTHLMIHREQHIGRSIYWAKDDYNDAFDEATEVGRELGVTVGGRKFFTESQRAFVPERDCTWPHDTSIIGVSGRVTPCCYWGIATTDNAFSAEGAFDTVWFGDAYQKLRAKRSAPPCRTCNILTTFDDITLHFSPFLKSHVEFRKRMSEYRQRSIEDIARLNSSFDEIGLDMALHRTTLRAIVGDTSKLENIDSQLPHPLSEIEMTTWDYFRKSPQQQHRSIRQNLFGRVPGIGWGPSEQNQHGQSWRWLGDHGGPASIFLRLTPGASYRVQFGIQTAASPGYLDGLEARVNGLEVAGAAVSAEGGEYRFSFVVPIDAVDNYDGYVWLTIDARDNAPGAPARRRIALSTMTIEPNGETVTSADIARERQLSARGMDPLIERHVAHLTGGTSQDAILEYLAALAAPAAVNFDIDLTKNFIGTEWAASESNVHGQTWRWLGQNSTIYARVRPGANYEVKLHIHTATSEEAFQGLTVLVNDQPLLDPFLRRDEGGCYLSGTICGDAIGSGALRLAISTVGEQLRTVAFSRLSVDETFVVEQSRPSMRRHASANA